MTDTTTTIPSANEQTLSDKPVEQLTRGQWWARRFKLASEAYERGERYGHDVLFMLHPDGDGFPQSAEELQRTAKLEYTPETFDSFASDDIYTDEKRNKPHGRPIRYCMVKSYDLGHLKYVGRVKFGFSMESIWCENRWSSQSIVEFRPKEEIEEYERASEQMRLLGKEYVAKCESGDFPDEEEDAMLEKMGELQKVTMKFHKL